MSEHPEPQEPISFGKYLLDEELARGGMSRVFRARLRGPGGFEKHLVVKQILPELAADPEFVKLFVREANTLVQLSHPNLVPVFELGVVDGVYFLAMELVQGATVEELLRQGPLPAALVAQIGAQIADALHYAHERFGIVHRDVTPRNVIVDSTGHARLLDFGIAARVEHTGLGELFGSPGYMAPEQLRGEALRPTSDLFSLGCVLHEAISGTPAWPQLRSASELAACAPPAPLHADSADEPLRELISQLLARDPAERPQAASVVAERLRTWLSQRHPRGLQNELAARVSKSQEQPTPPPRQSEQPPRASSGRIEVRSIAVSRELSALLAQATEKIPRDEREQAGAPGPEGTPGPPPPAGAESAASQRPPERMSEDPELHRVARRFLRDALLISIALLVAVLWPRAKRDEDEPEAAPSTQASARARGAEAAPAPADKAAAAVPSGAGNGAPGAASGAGATQRVPTRAPAAVAADDTQLETAEPQLKHGYLSVSAVPWAEVRVDGRLLGATPRRDVPLRAGKHALRLSCPPLAREASLNIELQPDQRVRISADMHESPPAITTQ